MGSRMTPNLAAATWRKARASDNQGACVRVAHQAGHVLVDDSKAPSPESGEVLVLSRPGFAALLRALG